MKFLSNFKNRIHNKYANKVGGIVMEELIFRINHLFTVTFPKVWEGVTHPTSTLREAIKNITNTDLLPLRLGTLVFTLAIFVTLVTYHGSVFQFYTWGAETGIYQKSEAVPCPLALQDANQTEGCWSITTNKSAYRNYDFEGVFYILKHDAADVDQAIGKFEKGVPIVAHKVGIRWSMLSLFPNVTEVVQFNSPTSATISSIIWNVWYLLMKIGITYALYRVMNRMFISSKMEWLWIVIRAPFYIVLYRLPLAIFMAWAITEPQKFRAMCQRHADEEPTSNSDL